MDMPVLALGQRMHDLGVFEEGVEKFGVFDIRFANSFQVEQVELILPPEGKVGSNRSKRSTHRANSENGGVLELAIMIMRREMKPFSIAIVGVF